MARTSWLIVFSLSLKYCVDAFWTQDRGCMSSSIIGIVFPLAQRSRSLACAPKNCGRCTSLSRAQLGMARRVGSSLRRSLIRHGGEGIAEFLESGQSLSNGPNMRSLTGNLAALATFGSKLCRPYGAQIYFCLTPPLPASLALASEWASCDISTGCPFEQNQRC
jgi:hypothetical protein